MSEVMDQAVIGMPYEMALGCEVSRRQYYSRANAVLAERDALAAKLAMLEDAAAKGDAARQQCGGMEMEIEELRAELAELRARVAVVPDASTVYAALDARERLFTSPENIQVALEAQSRLNGMTVSEELLRRLGQVISWQCFGDCRAFSDQRIPEPSEVIEELRALLSELEGGKP
ncbi:TPA: hypothetical protein L5P25_004905 [Pseudomonas aeruginosa]|jgi:hypothetical protein|uniref:hypothetical protein n=1 Tax=Pseudomonas aeruginosa TaxID=287 RepID=UPI0008FB77CC|nr:hypothetical protein [Pseudomonas aeruginosa]MBH8676528.1 hypothetical protein [Pseudomonas aeruginosa]OHW57241.1 hypothetical protein ABI36_0220120 [Pseudomonas aeruginosa]OPD74643.1 hypothetical protein AO910_34015 [Pseudomonas aeruginosa]OPD90993.1 hypothetical protein AO970_34570 [Pseudomonas aeruginosa]OZN89436.1 hypothetical protein CGQ11_26375 [Pseudomonas aeruginosa]